MLLCSSKQNHTFFGPLCTILKCFSACLKHRTSFKFNDILAFDCDRYESAQNVIRILITAGEILEFETVGNCL